MLQSDNSWYPSASNGFAHNYELLTSWVSNPHPQIIQDIFNILDYSPKSDHENLLLGIAHS